MVNLYRQEWKKVELLRRVGQMEQLAGIRLVEAGEGKARGCRLLDVWTGSGLRFQVNADRALDLSYCEFQGLPLAWRSPAGDVHPGYYEPEGLGWLRSFAGGLLTTCGLDQFGLPSEDGGTAFGLHGRVSNIPAFQVNHRAYWNDDTYQLEINAEIRQAALFGENLVLRRVIATSLGSSSIRIDDLVTNEGFEAAPHMLLYHFNLGFPLISEHSRLLVDIEETLPRDEAALSGLDEWNRFQAPTPGYREQVFIHRPAADSSGTATVCLVNPKLGIGIRWQYATKNLPYLMEWKMMGEGAYVVGIEPANCNGLGGRAAARAQGWLPLLDPGESRAYHFDLEVIQIEGEKEAGA
jgi:hypothetical protein